MRVIALFKSASASCSQHIGDDEFVSEEITNSQVNLQPVTPLQVRKRRAEVGCLDAPLCKAPYQTPIHPMMDPKELNKPASSKAEDPVETNGDGDECSQMIV